MPRRKNVVPKLVHHKASGQARVRIDGRDIYLGAFGSDEADEAYRRLTGEYLLTGRLPASGPAEPPAGIDDPGPSVNETILAYVRFARRYYCKDGEPTSELALILDGLKLLRQHYGSTPAADFSPLKLKGAAGSADCPQAGPQQYQLPDRSPQTVLQVGGGKRTGAGGRASWLERRRGTADRSQRSR